VLLAALLLLPGGCGPSDSPGPDSGKVESEAPAARSQPVSRIAFGSCAFQWGEIPILCTIAAAEPDLYLSLGDAIHGDFDGEKVFAVTVESLAAEWGKLAAHPDRQHLVAAVPVTGTWDNHGYRHRSAGAEFPPAT